MTSPKRIARAQHWAKSTSLPPSGSFQDELLIELANREKNLEFAKMYILVNMLGAEDQKISSLLDLFEAELHHDTYDPSFIERKRTEIQRRTAEIKARTEALKLKSKKAAAVVSAMSVSDNDLK